jgi:hypothetical protein
MTLRYPICRYATSVASLPRASAIRRWGTTHRSNRRRLGLLKYNAVTYRAATARAYAHLGMIKQALDLLRTLVRPLELAPGWVPNFTRMACDATSAVWLLNHVEETEVIERISAKKSSRPISDTRCRTGDCLSHVFAAFGVTMTRPLIGSRNRALCSSNRVRAPYAPLRTSTKL